MFIDAIFCIYDIYYIFELSLIMGSSYPYDRHAASAGISLGMRMAAALAGRFIIHKIIAGK